MINKTFLTERNPFIISRRLIKNNKADLIWSYRDTFKKSLILSLLLMLILFQLFPRHENTEIKKDRIKLSLEVIDIPITRQEELPPLFPPSTQEVIKNYTLIVQEEEIDSRKLRESLEKVKLHLDVKTNNSLLANSQIDNITYSALLRSQAHYDRGAWLNINSDVNAVTNHLDSPDFKLNTSSPGKKYVNNSVELDTPDLASTPNLKTTATEPQKNDTELIKISENQFLLKESESTIGTNEFRLWNKINAALDRLDKNRFGNLTQNVQRSTNGLTLLFQYDNGVQHEVFWSKGGKVVIRVTGTRPRQISDELQRALDSLIRLTL